MHRAGGKVVKTDKPLAMMREEREKATTQSQQRKDVSDCKQRKLASGARLVDEPTTTGAIADNDNYSHDNSKAEAEKKPVEMLKLMGKL